MAFALPLPTHANVRLSPNGRAGVFIRVQQAGIPHCQDAEKKTVVTKAPFPDKNPLTWHEQSIPVCLLGRPGWGVRCAVWFSTDSRKLWGKQKRAAFPQPWDMCLHCTQKNIDDSWRLDCRW